MKTRSNAHYGLVACSLAFFPLAVQAQNNDVDEGGTTTASLNPVVVTATLAPRTADETLSSVTVIDQEALRRQDPTSFTDLFRGQPGVDVQTNGSFGKSSSVYIRGVDNKGTLLLIDGIRLRSATLGAASWQHLDPRMFERAEIVRGPKGSLYGADAVGGVVQLFTPEGEIGDPKPYFSIGGGSHNSLRTSAGISGGSSGTRYSFAVSHFGTDGAPIREGGEDKGYRNTSGLVRLSHTFDNGARIGGLALHARGNTEFDSGDSDFVQQVAGVYGELPVTEYWRSRLTLSEARDELDTASSSPSVINTLTHTVRWENTFALGRHELIAGAEHSQDRISGTADYDENSRDNTALFAQALLDFSPVSVQAGLRYDDNEVYGEEVTGNLALGYDLDGQHTLRASYGTAFRAPTFNELYSPWGGGDPDINPETSENFELGIRGQYRRSYWDFAVFQNEIYNLIDWVEVAPWVFEAQNVDKARIRGVELGAGVDFDGWVTRASFTHLDPRDRGEEHSGKLLRRRATESFRLDLDREFDSWSLGASLIAQSRRYDDVENDERLSGFGLLNLRASWEFAPQWSARLTVDNVFDREYETSKDYINAGRTVFLSLNYGGW